MIVLAVSKSGTGNVVLFNVMTIKLLFTKRQVKLVHNHETSFTHWTIETQGFRHTLS